MVKTTRQRFAPGNDPSLMVQETGWAPGVICMGAENLALTGIRFPDCPVSGYTDYEYILAQETLTKSP